jgi:hypothetical protein
VTAALDEDLDADLALLDARERELDGLAGLIAGGSRRENRARLLLSM